MSTLLKQKLLMAFTTWCINFKKLVKLACSEIMRLFNAWKHSFWNRHPFTTWCIGMLVPVPSDWYWLKTFFTLPRKSSRGSVMQEALVTQSWGRAPIDWRLSFGFHAEGKEVLWCTKPWRHKTVARQPCANHCSIAHIISNTRPPWIIPQTSDLQALVLTAEL